jgi:hypothetical protein
MAKKRKRPGEISVDEYLAAADSLLDGLEGAAAASAKEVAPMRLQLAAVAHEAGARALARMQTAKVGRVRILIPTGKNTREALGASERVKERFSRFRLQWLDKGETRRLISEGFTKADQRNFFRHSNRLARNARNFLNRIGELEPTLQEEIDATLAQIDDASNDLLKMEVRSWTKMQETLLRNVQGRATRTAAGDAIKTFDLDRNLFNLSMLQHPKGVSRELLANASERMAARVTTKKSEVPKRALVFVGAGKDAVSKMTPDSRSARVVWKLFSARELDKRFGALNADRQSSSNWRGLGLAHNTPEFYIPIPPEIEDDVRREMRKRRRDFLARQKIAREEREQTERGIR